MYSLFVNHRRGYQSYLSKRPLHNLMLRMREDLTRVISYYQNGSFSVPNNHLVAKLINSIGTPLSYDYDRYVEVTRARCLFVANAMQLTTSIGRGSQFEGVFYPGCNEIIIADVGDDTAIDNWKNMTPIRVLSGPINTFGYHVPNGTKMGTEVGDATIYINLLQLMLMYRSFMLEQYKQGYTLQSTHHFVARYVLPGMLPSQTDIAIFNRMDALYTGAPLGKTIRKHPFYTTYIDESMNPILEQYLTRIEGGQWKYTTILKQLPLFYTNDHLQMPDIVETRQVWWALFYSRVRLIDFLISTGGEKGCNLNREHLAELKVDIKRFRSDDVFKQSLNEEQRYQVKLYFEDWNRK